MRTRLLPLSLLGVLLVAWTASKSRTQQPARPKTDPNALRQAAMNDGGDAKRGKTVYLSASAKCTICHKVQGQGGDVGPDLSQIGGKFDRTHLIESILDPSAEILQGYHATVIETKAGRTVTGIVKSETAKAVTLLDAEAKSITIAPSDIASRTLSKVSLMPEGLADALKPGEFADLIAYLTTLRTGPEPTPGQGTSGPLTLPAGFKSEVVATGLSGATALEIAPDGRIFICEQTGTLRIVKDGKLLAEPFVKLPVDATWERGLIGVTVAPDFPKTPHVFVCYVAAKPYPHHVVSRFTARGDTAEPGSEKILLEGDDQTKLGGTMPSGHQGGAIHFGKDGKLYIAIGDQTAGKPAQDLNSLLGKLLRINADGSIPDDNPFYSKTTGKYRAIWCSACAIPLPSRCKPTAAACSSTTWAADPKKSTTAWPAPITVGRSSNMARPAIRAFGDRSITIRQRASSAAPSPRRTAAGRRSIAADTSLATSITVGSGRSIPTSRPWLAPLPRACAGRSISASLRTAISMCCCAMPG